MSGQRPQPTEARAADGLEADLAFAASFGDLRQATAQVAGYLVLLATGSRDAVPEHPVLAAAAELASQGAERAREIGPLSVRAHSAMHLERCAALLGRALDGARSPTRRLGRDDVGAALTGLSLAAEELRRAAGPRSGLALVDYRHGCCAVAAGAHRAPLHCWG